MLLQNVYKFLSGTIIKKFDSYDAMQIDCAFKINMQEKYDTLNLQREHHKKFLVSYKSKLFDRSMIERPETQYPLEFNIFFH